MVGFPASRLLDLHVCPMFTLLVPHVGGPVLPPCMPTVLTGKRPQARLSDTAFCVGPPDVIVTGAATVLVGGLPAARMTDKTVHGGMLVLGEFTVLIGGPTFALPPNIKLEGSSTFQRKTIRDMFMLSRTPTGAQLIADLGASGHPITIVEHTGTNGFCTPNNGTDAGDGTGTGSVIQYNPDYRSNAYDSAGNLIAQPPQVILAHEMCHARANANGNQASGTDSAPPASEPAIEAEEAQAIGTGSYNGTSPSENSLRQDLGMPRRDNHFGTGGPAAGEPPPANLRPGTPPL
jgi:uncharacterized Zn-binding protein involved in type VI secretion